MEPLNQEYFQMHTFREMFIEDYMGFMKILEADILTSVQLLSQRSIEVPDIALTELLGEL